MSGTKKTGLGQVKTMKEFVWINKNFVLNLAFGQVDEKMKAKTDDKFLTDNQSNIAFSGEMNIIKSGDLDNSSLLSITGYVVYKTKKKIQCNMY